MLRYCSTGVWMSESDDRYSFYEEARRIYEETGTPEALVAHALKDQDLCEWLLGKGASSVIQEFRFRDRARAIVEVVAHASSDDSSELRREARARGLVASKATNRTRRLQHAIFDWPLSDGSRLGDATVEKLEHQAEIHRRIADGNNRMFRAFDTLAKKLRASGKQKLSQAIEGPDVAVLIGTKVPSLRQG
jgi:hypothetical protein